jgi:hypothetical protein
MAQASATTFHRLNEIMHQDDNRGAAVAAARTIEVMTNEAIGAPRSIGIGAQRGAGYVIDLSDEPSPGVVIQIINNPAPARPGDDALDITPNDESIG